MTPKSICTLCGALVPGADQASHCDGHDLAIGNEGHEALWGWFGLSRASWLTMPRVLMHAMPDGWQRNMAALLHEYAETFPNQPDLGTTVRCTTLDGKLTATPGWVSNYRYPDNEAIDALRKVQS